MQIRKPLQQFAERQEVVLSKHDDRGPLGWREESPEWLLLRLIEEVKELGVMLEAYRKGKQGPTVAKVQDEAVDVANFAMMIADVVEQEWLDWAVRIQRGERPASKPGLQREATGAPK